MMNMMMMMMLMMMILMMLMMMLMMMMMMVMTMTTTFVFSFVHVRAMRVSCVSYKSVLMCQMCAEKKKATPSKEVERYLDKKPRKGLYCITYSDILSI